MVTFSADQTEASMVRDGKMEVALTHMYSCTLCLLWRKMEWSGQTAKFSVLDVNGSWLNKQFWAHCGCFVCDDDCVITRTACLRCIFNSFYFTPCCIVQQLHKYSGFLSIEITNGNLKLLLGAILDSSDYVSILLKFVILKGVVLL